MKLGTSVMLLNATSRPYIFSDLRICNHSKPGKFKLLRCMQNMHQSTWDCDILYAEKTSKGEKLLRQFLCQARNTNMEEC
jgi:hypothetical protein